MNFADLVGPARVVKDNLGRRRFTGVNMSHDTDIAVSVDGRCAGHCGVPDLYASMIIRLPAIVRKRLVGVRHAMGVFTLFDGGAAILGSVLKFAAKTVCHRVFVTVTRCLDDPADSERLTPVRPDFNRNLIGRAANATRTDFNCRLHVFQSIMKNLYRILPGSFRNRIQRAIDDLFCHGLLAVIHNIVDELRQNGIAELGVRKYFPFSAARLRGIREAPLTWAV